MKKLMIISLALVTAVGFSQERERSQEMRQKMKQERQSMTPEERADKQTKHLTNLLQLNEVQQKQVHNLQLEKAKKFTEKRKEMKSRAQDTDKAKKTDNRSVYDERMKAILSESQYTTWKESKKRSKRGHPKKRQNNE